MALVAIDPSFTRTGVSVWVGNKIYVDSVSYKKEEAMGKDFQSIFSEADKRTDKVVELIVDKTDGEDIEIISEEPFPGGNFSAGLYAYDSLLFKKLMEVSRVKEIVNVSPTYLGFVHSKKKYTKTESVNIAKDWMDKIANRGIVIVKAEKRLSNDACESFIFLVRMAIRTGRKINGKSVASVLNNDRLLEKKEKILYLEDK